ncbi:MAG: ABC transporter permease [Gammaproteobacteria bacterium]|nr:ABC transporter permease [Gammaproteobacteria bacterium]
MSRGFRTLFYKEILRFHKVVLQTVVAPAITTLLYLLVFSHALEQHVTVFGDVAYATFLVPGLVMMTMIQNAFSNSSSSLIQSKITGNIVFILLTPLSYVEFYLAFMLAAVTRGLVVGLAVYLCAAPFVPLPLHSAAFIVAFALAGSAVLGTLGVIAGIWAEKFDQLAGFQNFIILPLSFLSGVFYSIGSLPEFWQQVSKLNPFFYMIDGFRYGFIGRSDVDPGVSLAVVTITFLLLSSLTLVLLRRGYRLRN